MAILVFGDGQINLKRIAGTACFFPPTIFAEELWVISSGTGNYVGTSGKLSRQYQATVVTGTADGTLIGIIKLP